jgi:hypothetical protein
VDFVTDGYCCLFERVFGLTQYANGFSEMFEFCRGLSARRRRAVCYIGARESLCSNFATLAWGLQRAHTGERMCVFGA